MIRKKNTDDIIIAEEKSYEKKYKELFIAFDISEYG